MVIIRIALCYCFKILDSDFSGLLFLSSRSVTRLLRTSCLTKQCRCKTASHITKSSASHLFSRDDLRDDHALGGRHVVGLLQPLHVVLVPPAEDLRQLARHVCARLLALVQHRACALHILTSLARAHKSIYTRYLVRRSADVGFQYLGF